ALNVIATDLRYTDLSALYAAVGEGHVSAQSIVGKLIKSAGGIAGAEEDVAETTLPAKTPRPLAGTGDSGVVVEDAADVWARLTKSAGGIAGAEEDVAETTLPAKTPRPLAGTGDSGVVVEDAADVWARLSK